MRLTVKLISESEPFVVNLADGRTIEDIFKELADNSSSFLLLGKRIIQKSVVEHIEAE